MVLSLVDVHTYYEDSYILHGVSLEVREGQVVALLGRNGAGKTTTIRSIMGLTPPRRGSINLKGSEITHLPSHRIAQLGIGFVPQGRAIFGRLTVKENLTMPYRPGTGQHTWTLEDIYSLFPILRSRARYRGNLLSGGEQQMLAIGRALMTNPAFLVMDEPSEGLAPQIIRDVVEVIEKLREWKLSILLVEQNLPLALEVADYVYVLSKGSKVFAGTPDELRQDHAAQERYLGVFSTMRGSSSGSE